MTFWALTLHLMKQSCYLSRRWCGVGRRGGWRAKRGWCWVKLGGGGCSKWHHTGRTEEKTHINKILMEAFPQVVQEGTLTRVGVQENKVLDAHTIPGRQRGLHVPQDPAAPLLQALWAKQQHVSLIPRCPPSLTEQFCAKVVNHLSILYFMLPQCQTFLIFDITLSINLSGFLKVLIWTHFLLMSNNKLA